MRALAAALLLLLAPALAAREARPPPDAFPDVARAYWVELDGEPLWAGRAHQRLPMASLAKLMTLLLVAESGRLEETLSVSAGAAGATGSRIGLRAGERVRVRDLFNASLVRSANDACRALADWHSGTQAQFVALMNQRAREWGMLNTRFANACGHDDAQAWSSAHDLALLSRRALAEPLLADAARLTEFSFTSLDGRSYRMGATNALLGRFDGATGLKTGYTPGAGRCLIAVAERDGHRVLAVLLNAGERWWDTVGLLELAFDEARRPAPP